jgi:hypothetical protein
MNEYDCLLYSEKILFIVIPTEVIPARRLAAGQADRESEVPVRLAPPDGQNPACRRRGIY